ncbi:hypothetical protein [Nonomuraea sp. C10]|uniref:hypothetical protein n=1 Tax=Nonomuraea sp. C10 TaxID=2600577 RepID=UPI0011CDC8DA|nr:hypothetical protein [Nonomuraea sp. C10]TXK34007.1 hypothetical protein FR742_31850 [Nonomuraea sp. C10]
MPHRTLVSQQRELLALADLLRRVRHELLARPHRAVEETVGRVGARLVGQPLTQVAQELAPPLLREQPAALVPHLLGQPVDVQIHGVVQVRDPVHRVLALQGSEEVGHVLAVPAHLLDRMQRLAARHAVHDHQVLSGLRGLGPAPLLELDHHVRVLARTRMHPGEHDVGASARQGELVLHEHLDPL